MEPVLPPGLRHSHCGNRRKVAGNFSSGQFLRTGRVFSRAGDVIDDDVGWGCRETGLSGSETWLITLLMFWPLFKALLITANAPSPIKNVYSKVMFKNGPSPDCFFVYFRLFEQTLQFLQQIHVKNVYPGYGAGIRTHEHKNKSLLP